MTATAAITIFCPSGILSGKIEMTKPTQKPNRPFFSSGPCAKRPGWSAAALSGAWTGRSHRAAGGKAKLAEVIDRSRAIRYELVVAPGPVGSFYGVER